MLSSPTYDAIARLTEEALKEIGDWGNVRDRVTIARRYAELLAGDPTRKDHGYGLSAALLDLSYIAIRQKRPALAADLQKLVIAIDAERLAWLSGSVTDYILEEPAKCPSCFREVREKTLVEWSADGEGVRVQIESLRSFDPEEEFRKTSVKLQFWSQKLRHIIRLKISLEGWRVEITVSQIIALMILAVGYWIFLNSDGHKSGPPSTFEKGD